MKLSVIEVRAKLKAIEEGTHQKKGNNRTNNQMNKKTCKRRKTHLFDRLTVAEIKSLCKWKKNPGDDPIPSKKKDLIRRWDSTKDRPSPHASPCNSDDEDNESYSGFIDSDASVQDDGELIFSDVEKSDGEEELNDEENSDEDE